MKIKTADFKSALDVVKPALANKEIIEQTTSFAFIGDSVVTYNDEISIKHPLKGLDINGVIKAEELFKFLGKVKDAELDIVVTDNEIGMKAGRAKTGFALNKDILLPLNEEIKQKGKWGDIPSTFLQACKFASAGASTDMSDPKLTCVHITKSGTIEASNNYRIIIWELNEELPIETTLIPATSIREVIKIQPNKVASGNGWVHFKNANGTIISCRTFTEKFVNTKEIVKNLGKVKKIKFPDGLLQVIEKAEIFSQEQKTDGSVTLDFTEGKVLVKSESTTAWFKETIKYDGDSIFSFSITPYLLKDILKQSNECGINENILKFTGPEWIYITSLRTYNKGA